eukprot:Em0023g640a
MTAVFSLLVNQFGVLLVPAFDQLCDLDDGESEANLKTLRLGTKTTGIFLSLPELVHRLDDLHHNYRNLGQQLSRLKEKIASATENVGITLDDESDHLLRDTLTSSDTITHFQGLPHDSFQYVFWQQQAEAASKPHLRNMRWHPLMIRWCLYLRYRSSGAYDALRESGCIKLPSQRTLRDYTHYTKASLGFSSEADQMLIDAVKPDRCPEREKHIFLLLDEMHIRDDLVFDKHSGNLIGFTDLGDISNHLSRFENSLEEDGPTQPQLAKTVLVFMVRGIFSKLQIPYVQFSCTDLSGVHMYDPFWEAVQRLENMELKVMGVTMDGASPNRKLMRLHKDASDATGIVYKVYNPFSEDKRHLYFISDPPHLVLSETVSKGLLLVCGEEAFETSHFVNMADKFFDALNVHNFSHGIRGLKSFQLPYTSSTDVRLKWLETDFLGYLKDWENSVKLRKGFTKAEKNNMLISAETLYGLQVTCMSFVELVRYLFTVPDVQCFLSQRLCQDPLERFFGAQRQRSGVHDNPNVAEFAKNTQAIRVVNSFCQGIKRGNCRGGDTELPMEQPMPKRHKRKPSSVNQVTTVESSVMHTSDGILMKGIHALLAEKSFYFATRPAQLALKIATSLPNHSSDIAVFENKLKELLSSCLASHTSVKGFKLSIWQKYHQIWTSDSYQSLCMLGIMLSKSSSKSNFTVRSSDELNIEMNLTYEELNGIRYAAGFVPRAIKKKLQKKKKSDNPLNKDCILCLDELISGDADAGGLSSSDWVNSLNRGGLVCVNDMTFELFLSMELELRSHLKIKPTHLGDEVVVQMFSFYGP